MKKIFINMVNNSCLFMLAIKLTTKATKDLYYQEKEQATYKTLMAYQTIKQYRLNHDISLSDPSQNNKLLDPQKQAYLVIG